MSNYSNYNTKNISKHKNLNGMNARLSSIQNDEININKKNNRYDLINRLDLEREFMKDSLEDSKNDFGEIEEPEDVDVYDRGMPSRPIYNTRKQDNNEYHTDFNLFNKSGTKLKKVNYNETSAQYAEVNCSTKISEHIQDKTLCSNGINDYTMFLFNNLNKIMNSSFISSPYLIYVTFSSLFLGSSGNTEIETKNYFNYPRNDILNDGLVEHLQRTNNLNNCVLNSCLMFADDIHYNENFCKYISKFVKIRKIALNNIPNEVNIINNIINKSTKHIMKTSVSHNTLHNLDVVLLNYGYFEPIFENKFNIVVDKFNDRKHHFLHASFQTFGYYQAPSFQLLEIKCINDDLVMGIIIGELDLTDKLFMTSIEHIAPTVLQTVLIPMFNIQTKMKYINILKQTDLTTVFTDLDVPELFEQRTRINDLIQNLEINITGKCSVNSKNTLSGYRTDLSFIVNKTFRFYFRVPSINTIILVGTYL